ncbi:MAG: alpha/beta hydrolase [Candidatus Bathyarchaeota archaeon]|nr:alpha/beta hydrolase [Candidatus Bathyarchaeota archaeon]
MPYAKSGDIEIYYNAQGQGTPLLLQNGWGGSSDSWSTYMVEMLAEKHKVIVMDNRGTGRSGKPDFPYTMDMMANDSVAVLDSLGIEKAHVMGFSMGGIITQTIGLEHPNRLRSLVLCGTTLGGEHRISPDPKVQMDLALIANPLPEMTERDVTVKLLYLLYSKGYVEANLKALILDETYSDNPTPSFALNRQSQAIGGFESYDRLPSIDVPVLVMTGEEDLLVPPENSGIIAERVKKAKLVTFPSCGHGFLKQKTDDVVPVILNFLRKVDEG